jgi:hypothetical protein
VTVKQIKDTLREAGITGLKITLFVDGRGAVVADEQCLWTCRQERLLRAAESMVEDGTAERLARLDGNDQAELYSVLCRRAGYLARGSAEDLALHERIVQEWREANPGCGGNWS